MSRRYVPRAFTLIELLVVIAIIGILSSVVLASLNTARSRGKDATIKSQMAQMRSQADIFFASAGSYKATGTGGNEDSVIECTNPTNGSFLPKFTGTLFDPTVTGNIAAQVQGAVNNRNVSAGDRILCSVSADGWALAVPLYGPTSGMSGWCVDGSGAAKEVSFDFSAANPTALMTSGTARCP